MIDDPVLRALEQANPVPDTRHVELRPLGPLPARRSRTPAVALTALVLALVAALALWPSSTPGGDDVLARAFAGGEPMVLSWRVRVDEPGLGAWTDDVWMHVRADGTIDRVRELRLDGRYAGLESVIEQPFGIGDLRDAVTRTRSGPDRPIRTAQGMGIGEFGFAEAIATVAQAARGARAIGEPREVTFEGREAFEFRIREAKPPHPGHPRNPSQLPVTLWLERESGEPLTVRWGEGSEIWRTVRMERFARLPGEAAVFELR
jgi:hypothetical protein